MGHRRRGLLATMTQSVRSPETGTMVTRAQSFTHRGDTTVSSATHDGRTTTYARSPAGWTESLTDWRGRLSTFAFSPAGSPTVTTLGSGAASSTRSYHPDGSVASLVWSAGGTTVRSHTGLSYDVGGLRTAENVAVVHPLGVLGTDTGGPAAYAYDLARRLVSSTSAYKAALIDTAKPTTTYTLDDGANIANATTTVGGQTRVAESSTYPGGRLATRHRVVTPPVVGASTTTDTTFAYSTLGEETTRSSSTAGGLPPPPTVTTYDAAGHVASADAVTYAYDGADHLLSRKAGGETTLYFYLGGGATLAEETDGSGASLARYVVDGTDLVAQHTFRRIPGAGKDPSDTAGTWAWLLDDPAGNMATTISDTGAVLTQAAFDPYGVPEALGGSQAPGTKASSLGFQGALTDPTTKRVILGPRQYDPTTARFTNPDVFVGGAADVALGADALTGNRYLFAAANPVAYYEDGHCFGGKDRRVPRLVDQRRRSLIAKVAGVQTILYYTEKIYRSEKVCVRGGVLGEALDYGLGNDISRGVVDAGYSNRFTSVEHTTALWGTRILIDRGCLNGAAQGAGIGSVMVFGGAISGFIGGATGALGGCIQAVARSVAEKDLHVSKRITRPIGHLLDSFAAGSNLWRVRWNIWRILRRVS